MKVVITDYKDTLNRDLQMEIGILNKMLPGCEIVVYEYKNDKEELKKILSDADAVKTAFVMLDREILMSAKKLKCISFNSTGYNNVDLQYARELGIDIIHVPEYCTYEVADHTMMLILALNKNLKIYDKIVSKEHKWGFNIGLESHSLKNRVLGIIGFGKIGQAVAKRAQAFGIKVIVCSSHLSNEQEELHNVTKVTMEELCRISNIISLHTNLTPNNEALINEKFFKSLKNCPIFINVSRGLLVDEKALIRALDEKRICAAGLDVLESEKPNLEKNELCGRDNVIITPHAAFYSEEAINKLHTISTENIGYYLQNKMDLVHSIIR